MSSTVGEVGLSEIKLAPKSSKEDITVRYRIHSNVSRENRLVVTRPHTMSAVSPYSSTSSLNSMDSSLIMMNQRVNSNGGPIAPSRKKRTAPRPPSQNSIPENPEKVCSKNESNLQMNQITVNSKVDPKHSNLLRPNFHMSSPNLAINSCSMYKSDDIDTNAMIHNNNFDRRQSEICLTNNKKIPLNRPLSIQYSKTANNNHLHEIKSPVSDDFASSQIQYHSRAPSDTSVINDIPEPQPRSRPPLSELIWLKFKIAVHSFMC